MFDMTVSGGGGGGGGGQSILLQVFLNLWI